MADIISVTDLPDSLQGAELIDLMVDGLNAKASRVAPCLASTDPAPSVEMLAEARLVLVGIIKRWVEAGSGAVVQQTAGVFSQTVDSKQRPGWNMWPSDIEQLQDLCKTENASKGKAFSVDVGPACLANHLDVCALTFGALYCSCGSDINGGDGPLYGGGQ